MENNSDDDDIIKIKHRRQKLDISDDESDNNEDENGPVTEQLTSILPTREDHVISSKDASPNNNNPEEKTRKCNLIKSTLLNDSDFENSEDEQDNDNENCHQHYEKTTFSTPNLQILNNNDFHHSDEEENELCSGKSNGRNKKKQKKKKSDQVDSRFEIFRETARLTREKNVSLPYHRPKQRSLTEFFSRQKGSISVSALRTVKSSMIDTWKEIDNKTKTALQFFGSDSEGEKEVDDETNVPCSKVLGSSVKNVSEKPQEDEELRKETECCSKSCDNEQDKSTGIALDDSVNDSVIIKNREIPQESEITMEERDLSIQKTNSWLDKIVAYEKKEKKLRNLKINPEILSKVPALSREADSFIDLDDKSGELKAGAKVLMDRLFENLQSHKPKKNKDIVVKATVTQSNEKGELTDVKFEEIVVKGDKADTSTIKLQDLKLKLKEEMMQQWQEEFQKRQEEAKKKKEGFEDDVEAEDEIEEEGLSSEATTESEPEEDDVEIREQPRATCAFGDSEAEESENDGDDEYDADGGDDGDDEDNADGGDDGNDEDNADGGDDDKANADTEDYNEASDQYSPQSLLPAHQPEGATDFNEIAMTQTQLSLPLPLPDISPLSLQSPGVREPATTPLHATGPVYSPKTKNDFCEARRNLFQSQPNKGDVIDNDDDVFAFVSGVFPSANPSCDQVNEDKQSLPETQDENDSISKKDLVDPYSLVDEDEGEEEIVPVRRKKQPLKFSDDEEEEDIDESDKSSKDGSKLRIVEYDSEENEIEPDKNVNPTEFFENEAELSESEWSGDEDERGLDRLDEEEGDKDILDSGQVAEQLGKIHMRRMLDQDTREVRMIQELFLEDGDLHTDGRGRERKYRWQNMDGWNDDHITELQNNPDSDGEDIEHNLLQRAQIKEINSNYEDNMESLLSKGLSMMQSLEKNPVTIEENINSQGAFAKNQIKAGKGIFLSQSKNYLSRLARTTTLLTSDHMGPTNSNRFLFKSKSPQKEATGSFKRKSGNSRETAKRARLDTNVDIIDPVLH